jgi:ubiquitin-protein ligase
MKYQNFLEMKRSSEEELENLTAEKRPDVLSCSVVFKDGSSRSVSDILADTSNVENVQLFTNTCFTRVRVLGRLMDQGTDVSSVQVYGYKFPTFKGVDFNALMQPVNVFHSCHAWQPPVEQTKDSMSEFLSCLYVLRQKLLADDKNILMNNLLRCGMFTPAVCALFRLLHDGSHRFGPYEKALVSHEFYELFCSLSPETEKVCIFGESIRLFTMLMQKKDKGIVDGCKLIHHKRMQLICSVSFKTLTDPVEVVDERSAETNSRTETNSNTELNSRTETNGNTEPKERVFLERENRSCERYASSVVREPVDVILFLQSYGNVPSMLHLDVMPFVTDAADLRAALTVANGSNELKAIMKNSLLRLIPPLSLKSASIPVLTKSKDMRVVVCSSKHGDKGENNAAHTIRLLDLIEGKESGADPHDLANALSNKGVDLGCYDDRKCEEITYILLDCSTSMNNEAYENEFTSNKFVHSPEKWPDSLTIQEAAMKMANLPQFNDMKEHFSTVSISSKSGEYMKILSYAAFGHEDFLPRYKYGSVIEFWRTEGLLRDKEKYFEALIAKKLQNQIASKVQNQIASQVQNQNATEVQNAKDQVNGMESALVNDDSVDVRVRFIKKSLEKGFVLKHKSDAGLLNREFHVYSAEDLTKPIVKSSLLLKNERPVSLEDALTILKHVEPEANKRITEARNVAIFHLHQCYVSCSLLDVNQFKSVNIDPSDESGIYYVVLDINLSSLVNQADPVVIEELVEKDKHKSVTIECENRSPFKCWFNRKVMLTTLHYAAVYYNGLGLHYEKDGTCPFLVFLSQLSIKWRFPAHPIGLGSAIGFKQKKAVEGSSDSLPTIQIYAKTLTGLTFSYTVNSKHTIGDVKKMIRNDPSAASLKPVNIRLIFAGRLLSDSEKCHDVLQNESTLFIVLRISPDDEDQISNVTSNVTVNVSDCELLENDIETTVYLSSMPKRDLHKKDVTVEDVAQHAWVKINSSLTKGMSSSTKEAQNMKYSARDCAIFGLSKGTVKGNTSLTSLKPVTVYEIGKDSSVVMSSFIPLTIVSYPCIEVETDRDTLRVHFNDTCLDVRIDYWKRHDHCSNSPYCTSLWSGMSDGGDGVSVGCIHWDNEPMYSKVKNSHLRIEWRNKSEKWYHAKWKDAEQKEQKYLSRLTVAQQCFETFLDKTAAFDFPHRVALYTFSSDVKLITSPTGLLDNFRQHLAETEARGNTKLYDCVIEAANHLVEYKKKNAASLADNVKSRIIVLTDGEDFGSTRSHKDVCKVLVKNGIVLDGICVCPEESQRLAELAYASGGCAFHPKSTQDQLQIVELEVFLKLGERQYTVPADNYKLKMGNWARYSDFSGPHKPKRVGENFCMPVTANPLKSADFLRGEKGMVMRILSEFKAVTEFNHPNYECYIVGDDVTKWRVIMVAPKNKNNNEESSPYKGGVFVVNVKFPSSYPETAPEVRFETPILHVNTNQYGKVCHDIVGRGYDRDQSMVNILNSVYGLLLVQETNSPFDSTLATLFHENIDAYYTKIREHVKKYASVNVRTITELVKKGMEISK